MLETDIGISANDTTVYLKDYRAPVFKIIKTDLLFELGEQKTLVTSTLSIKAEDASAQKLILNGEKLELVAIKLNGVLLEPSSYEISDNYLTVDSVPNEFELTVVTQIEPQNNTELSGLYKSSGNFCTQCEAEGFRRITYFLDRPDVLSVYSVKIIADREKYPVLLSNGNPDGQGELDGGLHWVKWHDPHPKPSYLFALVAGDLKHISDRFVTASGRQIELNIYTQAHNIDQCDHAMQSLINAMKWDEQVYGREYDLDVYNIVAVDDFNMGAMENKGLNIFNSKYVLADTSSATDADFDGIESVIAHEYFHNWSGNRVTCRDWFQLSLKEGFTVFRDQEFSADMGSRGVKRVKDVNLLRNYQFKEDAGPMAHPVRPDSYQEINNFYTVTIYEKGAEVIRMMYHLLGADRFRKGTDYYFEQFDGQAVTTEDFVQSMENTNAVELKQFRLWYTQAGTPELNVETSYRQETKQFVLRIEQTIPDTPGQKNKQAMKIPISIALYDQQANKLQESVVSLSEMQQEFVFDEINTKPILSFLRGFSAPVKVNLNQSIEDLVWLSKYDDDGFVRWESSQKLALKYMLAKLGGSNIEITEHYFDALSEVYGAILEYDNGDDLDLIAQMLNLPSESYISEQCNQIDPLAIHKYHTELFAQLARQHQTLFEQVYRRNVDAMHINTREGASRRAIKNAVLPYLASLENEYETLIRDQFDQADNMTDQIAAFASIVEFDLQSKAEVVASFYQQWQNNTLVLDKWFALQAGASHSDGLSQVKALMQHPKFSLNNPNKVRALIASFVTKNVLGFHNADGSGYQFLADIIIELNSINPQIAARLASQFNNWKSFKDLHKSQMQTQLQRIAQSPDLAKDIREIVEKALA